MSGLSRDTDRLGGLADKETPALRARGHGKERAVLQSVLQEGRSARKQTLSDIQEGFMKITPHLADLILTQANFVGQRTLNRNSVQQFRYLLENDEFLEKTQIAFAQTPAGNRHLVNGQHRLAAISEANVTMSFQVAFYDCDNEEQVARLYGNMDRSGIRRSQTDTLAALGFHDRSGLSKTMGRTVVNAMPVLANKLRPASAHKEPKFAVTTWRVGHSVKWLPAARTFEDAIEEAPSSIKTALQRAFVVAVALATIEYQEKKAVEFWRGVATDEGLLNGDPRKALHRKLLTTNLNKPRTDIGAIIAAAAWNAWYKGRNLQEIHIPKIEAVCVLGTPYDGK